MGTTFSIYGNAYNNFNISMKNIHRHIMKTVDKVSRTVVRSIDGTKEIKTVSNANIVINSLDANIRMYVIYNMVDIENYYVS